MSRFLLLHALDEPGNHVEELEGGLCVGLERHAYLDALSVTPGDDFRMPCVT